MSKIYIKSRLTDVNKLATNYANKKIDINALAEGVIGIWKSCTQTTLNWKVLKYVANTYTDNDNIDHIRAKLYMLDKLYNSNTVDIDKLSTIIKSKNLNFKTASKEKLLESFEDILSKNVRKNTVALSKFFALNSPTVFPIQDSLAVKALQSLITNRNDLEIYLSKGYSSSGMSTAEDMAKALLNTFNKIATDKSAQSSVYNLHYKEYISIVDYFKEEKGLTYDYRTLDKFLWLYGKTL